MTAGRTSQDFVFRKIRKEEFDKLHDLFPDDESTWKMYRAMRLQQLSNLETDIYVVDNAGEFVGEVSVNYVSHDLEAEAVPQQRVYLDAFRVDERYQGKGLGQGLLSFVLSDLEKRGYTEFTIGVDEDNEIAKHIYFKYGFTEEVGRGRGDEFAPTDYTLYMRSVPVHGAG